MYTVRHHIYHLENGGLASYSGQAQNWKRAALSACIRLLHTHLSTSICFLGTTGCGCAVVDSADRNLISIANSSLVQETPATAILVLWLWCLNYNMAFINVIVHVTVPACGELSTQLRTNFIKIALAVCGNLEKSMTTCTGAALAPAQRWEDLFMTIQN